MFQSMNDGLMVLNEHSDLHFYCINSVHRVHLLNWKNEFKKSSEGKKDVAKSVHEACCLRIQIRTLKATTWWTFWNCMIFPQTICYIVPYARDLLPIKFFFFKFYIKCTVTDDITRVIGTNTAINGVRLALSFRDLSTNITRS